MSRIDKGLSYIHSEGILEFVKRTIQFVSQTVCDQLSGFQWQVRKFRGRFSVSIGDVTAWFVAHDRQSVENTLRRFREEQIVIKDMLNELNDGDVFYDIGANTGLYTCFASHRCSSGNVIAIEPYGPNIKELHQNVDLNGENVTIINKALSNETKTGGLSVPDFDSPGHGTASIDDASKGYETVELVRGDELINQNDLPQPNVIKIDVEGAEPLVLEGLRETLQNEDCQLVYCEVHLPVTEERPSIYDHEVTPSDVRKRLEDWGYDVTRLLERGSEYTLKAQRLSS